MISARLVEGALNGLERLGAQEELVIVYRVPGAFEVPSLALRLAKSGKFDAIICVGTIIRGQTPHFEYIAGEVTRGIGEAGLQTGVPVVFGVVTADNLDQAIEDAGIPTAAGEAYVIGNPGQGLALKVLNQLATPKQQSRNVNTLLFRLSLTLVTSGISAST